MRPPRRGEIWSLKTKSPQRTALIISSTVYNEIADDPTVLVALMTNKPTDEGFCVDLGEEDWAVMGLVTYVPKLLLVECLRRVDVQVLTDVNTMLFKILATPER